MICSADFLTTGIWCKRRDGGLTAIWTGRGMGREVRVDAAIRSLDHALRLCELRSPLPSTHRAKSWLPLRGFVPSPGVAGFRDLNPGDSPTSITLSGAIELPL